MIYHFRMDVVDGSQGGILVYVKQSLDASLLEDFESDFYEAIWVKVVHPDLKITSDGSKEHIVTIGKIYRRLMCFVESFGIFDFQSETFFVHLWKNPSRISTLFSRLVLPKVSFKMTSRNPHELKFCIFSPSSLSTP